MHHQGCRSVIRKFLSPTFREIINSNRALEIAARARRSPDITYLDHSIAAVTLDLGPFGIIDLIFTPKSGLAAP